MEVKKKTKIPLKLFNTMGRKKQAFKPLKAGSVGMYSCGPTVYDYVHIGHFRAYIFVDTLKRVLEFNKFKLRHVMNITDVGHLTSDADTGEDKIEKAAREKKMSAWDIAAYYTKDFFDAMRKLNVQRADIVCKATDHVKEMIKFVQKIEQNGYTYKTSDGIYLDTSKIKDYGKLAGLDKKRIEGLKPGARIQFSAEKKNVTDFALWKFSRPDVNRQMEWDSPWGRGFPGWHIECSAMGTKYLGETFDIHTGGIDLIPIHHTNEIAQSKAATGKDPVKFWLHNEFVLVEGTKMSKSKKNFYNMADIEAKGFDPLALRYLFLTAHHRSKINFTWESLAAAERTLDALRDHILEWKKSKAKIKSDKKEVETYETKFIKAINDDLNTPIALSVIWKLVRAKDVRGKDKLKLLLKFDEVLGLRLKKVKPAKKKKLSDKVKELIKKREEFRKTGKYQEADEIRKRLREEFGVLIEDVAKGTKWKLKKKK